ncbi:glutathione S-transferase family protein [Sphingomonas sp. RB3P16]|uniref:glutathione S-transferase family protein n=1 Tax=Parasphingomonas frigoris TaxID=3096163 RepID=UPI002FC9F3C0
MIELFGHPFSSYTWKVLIALHENATPFTFRMIEDPAHKATLAALWPVGKFPVLREGERVVVETSTIIEYLQTRHTGPVLFLPADPAVALEVRMLDRVFDNHVMNVMTRAVVDAMRPPERRDPDLAASVGTALDQIYGWLDTRLAGRVWAAGDAFTLADCAGAPSLFYADWVHPIADRFAVLKGYRARVLARTSVARCVDEARPYRHYFPLGAPDRD